MMKVLMGQSAPSRVLTNLTSWYSGLNNTSAGHSSSATNWYDSSKNNKTGTLTSITWGDKYAQFNGTSSKVSCGVQNSGYFTSDWHGEFLSSPSANQTLKGNYVNTTGYWFIRFPSGAVGIIAVINGSTHSVTDPVVANINTKYHFSASYDGSTLKLYKNGALAASKNVSGILTASSGQLYLGALSTGSYCNMKVYDTADYSAALSEAENTQNRQYCISTYGV
jgi:hypothetical protein